MSKIRVGVLRGGLSSEYDISLLTGGNVLRNLSEERYIPLDIFISREGIWHLRGLEIEPRRALEQVDVVFNALHGGYGEDGKVQSLLELFRKPYTGSRGLPSSVTLNKSIARKRLSHLRMRMPLSMLLNQEEYSRERAVEIFKTFPQPCIIKPPTYGSSIGIAYADSLATLIEGIEAAFAFAPVISIEEFIKGKEATCGIVEDYRGESVYSLFPTEVHPAQGRSFCNHVDRYAGTIQYQCPGNFTWKEKDELRNLTQEIHKELGLRHYSSSDFIVTPRGIYFLETDALPALFEHAPIPHALQEGGTNLSAFLDHLITLALERK
jgi:D-alanine-D-alanine ligase